MRFFLPFSSLIDKENEPYENPVTMLCSVLSSCNGDTHSLCVFCLFSVNILGTQQPTGPTPLLHSSASVLVLVAQGWERRTIDLVTSAHILLGGYTQILRGPDYI